jgi:shikimate kinase / 3-dehydroquinate synthase
VIVLVGFMGAGKTTVGRLLADSLNDSFVDADDEIEERAGASIPDIFEAHGEHGFRALERDVVDELLAGNGGVVGLGGGALGEDGTRRSLASRDNTTVVYLDVAHDEALRRIGPAKDRPMLALSDSRLLHDSRRAVYESVADITVSTDGRSPQEVAIEILAALGSRQSHGNTEALRVEVVTGASNYDVLIGSGVVAQLGPLLAEMDGPEQAFVVTQTELRAIAIEVARSARAHGLKTSTLEIPSGEIHKSLEVAGQLYDRLADAAAHRHDVIVSVGGGVVTDIAGFVASTFNRGIPVVHVATSLLAQVDAAVGGKTGVNLHAGKNLVGTFHQPNAVLCDVDLLKSLPQTELRAGLAEVIKYGFIADPSLLELVERDAERILQADPDVLTEVVYRSVQIKAGIVAIDEHDRGHRAVLNYGHTFAHAIEHAAAFQGVRHGEAVALGMMAAAHLGHLLGRFDRQVVEAHRRVLEIVGLPVTASLDIDVLERAWLRDKKYLHGVRFVLLKAIGEAEINVEAPRTAIATALERLAG